MTSWPLSASVGYSRKTERSTGLSQRRCLCLSKLRAIANGLKSDAVVVVVAIKYSTSTTEVK